MKRKSHLIYLLTIIMMLPVGVQAKKQEKGKEKHPHDGNSNHRRTGSHPWVKLLWKISYPVIHNLAEGTLHQNMPIETRSG